MLKSLQKSEISAKEEKFERQRGKGVSRRVQFQGISFICGCLHQDRSKIVAIESNCQWTFDCPKTFSKWIALGKRLDRAHKVRLSLKSYFLFFFDHLMRGFDCLIFIYLEFGVCRKKKRFLSVPFPRQNQSFALGIYSIHFFSLCILHRFFFLFIHITF